MVSLSPRDRPVYLELSQSPIFYQVQVVYIVNLGALVKPVYLKFVENKIMYS